MPPDEPGRGGGSGAPPGPPDYKLYRSRPRWFKGPGRAGEPGFDELRDSRRGGREGRPRKPLTAGRGAEGGAIPIAARVGLSLLPLPVSAPLEQSNASAQAKKGP